MTYADDTVIRLCVCHAVRPCALLKTPQKPNIGISTSNNPHFHTNARARVRNSKRKLIRNYNLFVVH